MYRTSRAPFAPPAELSITFASCSLRAQMPNRLMRAAVVSIAATLAAMAAVCPPVGAQERPIRATIAIPRVQQPPRLEDYVPLEPGPPGNGAAAAGAVERGVRVDTFLQRDPGDLTPASQRTEAYLSYDADQPLRHLRV